MMHQDIFFQNLYMLLCLPVKKGDPIWRSVPFLCIIASIVNMSYVFKLL